MTAAQPIVAGLALSDYYMTAPLYEPPFFQNREFAIIKKDLPMWRHLAFANVEKLRAFLIEHAPLHVYFSSAKYEYPAIEDMPTKKKYWLGSDLTFDIDNDHLKKKTLIEAKKQVLKLLSILIFDFGFQDLTLTFSGRRGYHVYVRDECIQKCGNAERREIADYFQEFYPGTEKLDEHGKKIQGSSKKNPNYIGIDAQVTADFTRLIRLPGTIHGGSGLMCEIIQLDSIEMPLAPKQRKQKQGFDRFARRFMAGRV